MWMSYGGQNNTCYCCLNVFCNECAYGAQGDGQRVGITGEAGAHEDQMHLIYCGACHKEYCRECVPSFCCVICEDFVCDECVEKCETCEQGLCKDCITDCRCKFCGRTRCKSCAAYHACRDCRKQHCVDCYDGKECNVRFCDGCRTFLCTECNIVAVKNSKWTEMRRGCNSCASHLAEEVERLQRENAAQTSHFAEEMERLQRESAAAASQLATEIKRLEEENAKMRKELGRRS